MKIKIALIDSGPLVAYYNGGDDWNATALKFFDLFKGRLITSVAVVTEVMWLLDDWRAQNDFLQDLERELYDVESIIPQDFKYIAELNEKYQDVPGDFADLTIVALSERLGVVDVVSLDADFDIYRAYSNKRFNQLFPKWEKPSR